MFNLLKKQKIKLENELAEIEKIIQTKSDQIDDLNFKIKTAENSLLKINQNIDQSKKQLKEYKLEICSFEGIISMQELGMNYEPIYHDLNTIAYEKTQTQEKIGKLLGCGKAIITTRVYRIDGSEAKGKQFQKTFCENLLIGFNSYFNQKKKAISSANIVTSKDLITKKFVAINKKAALMGVSINQQYLDLCLELLTLELEEKLCKIEEKEKLKEEHRRLKEQEKLLAEAEKAKLELQKQRRMYEQSLVKALNEQERQEFEAKLKEIDKREADVDYRINNSKAGYLYITATKAMPNMTKLGVTRRLNPLVRIQELSSAATPYPFVCYGLVFGDDAFDLETRIHEYFE